MQEDQTDQNRQARRIVAREIYQSYSISLSATKKFKNSDKFTNSENTGKYSKKEDASFSEEDGLLLLQLLSEGRTVAKIHSTCPPFQNHSLKKLHNLYRCTLLKLFKTLIQVLPRQVCQMQVLTFQKTYFKNAQMMAYYCSQGLDLNQLFDRLAFLRNWRKEYDWYLERGYGQDYLPEEVVCGLEALPNYYSYIRQLYDNSPFRSKAVKSKKNTSLTRVSQRQNYSESDEQSHSND